MNMKIINLVSSHSAVSLTRLLEQLDFENIKIVNYTNFITTNDFIDQIS